MAKKEAAITGLDVGTTKVCAVIGRIGERGDLEIIGSGCAESQGVKKGVIVNLEDCVRCIKRAVEEAEANAGLHVESAYVALSGAHVRSFNSRGSVSVKGRGCEVSSQDIRRVIEAARAVAISADQEIIHVLPQEYIIDGKGGISYPLAMSGSKLEVSVHVVAASSAATQNLITAVNRSGLLVAKTILQQLAVAEAVLTQDEKELGVALVDMGGGTTNVAVFQRGVVWHTAVLPTGGDNFTRDIAIGLRTPLGEAERIKRSWACALPSAVADDEEVEVPGIGGREAKLVPRRLICQIVQPRAEEILSMVRGEIESSGFGGKLTAGAVLTGGCSMLSGIVEAAEEILGVPVRRGYPMNPNGLDQQLRKMTFAAALGLVLHAYQEQRADRPNSFDSYQNGGLFGRWILRAKEWWRELVY